MKKKNPSKWILEIPILAYHLVTDELDVGFARTTVRQFQQQMDWLYQRGFKTLTLKKYIERKPQEISIANKYVILTFDDAYESLQDAANIMSAYGFVGSCFAISDFVGRFNDWDYQFCGRKFKHADYSLLISLMDMGWEVGSHSKRHAFLPGLNDQDLLGDLMISRQVLENHLNCKVVSISYPFGKADDRVCKLARRAGYACGVSLGIRLKKALYIGQMCLPRLGIYLFDRLTSFARRIEHFGEYPYCYMNFFKQQLISSFSKGTLLLTKLK